LRGLEVGGVRNLRNVIVGMAVLGALALTPAAAWGALSFPFDGQIAPAGGSFGFLNSNSVAVSDANSHTYVADSESDLVYVFDSAGAELAALNGADTPDGSFGEHTNIAVAVDNGTGSVYVLDALHGAVDRLDAAGKYVCQITGRVTPSSTECNTAVGSETPSGGFSTPRGLAIDETTGDVYVLDAENGVIHVFDSTGAFLRDIELSTIPGGFEPSLTRGLAVSGFNHHVFVAEDVFGFVAEFDAAGNFVTAFNGANTPGEFFAGEISVAANDSDGHLYITDPFHGVTDAFDSAGNYLTQFSHSYNLPTGTAVDQGTGRVYVSDDAGTPVPSVVKVFGPPVVIPDVRTEAASGIGASEATLNGVVNPDDTELTDCHFDYGTTSAYGQTAPCIPAATSIAPDASDHAVTAAIAGLQPGSTYHFRLVAVNSNGSNAGGDVTFSTLPRPSIDSASAVDLTRTTATLKAAIDPNGFTTTYRFEWGTTTAYGNRVPIPDESIGEGVGDVTVSQPLSGLSADTTTYHWRVVASNANGTTVGVDHSFVYRIGGPGLPDDRAYEMVTPPSKDAALIGVGLLIPSPDVSADGSRLVMTSIQCLIEAPSCTGTRQNEGEPYEFSRTSSGWRTTPLAPPPGTEDANSAWLANADEGTALFSIPNPSSGEDDFYGRLSDGALAEIGPATPPASGPVGPVFGSSLILATPSLSKVAYELKPPLTWPFDDSVVNSAFEFTDRGSTAPVLVGVRGGAGDTKLVSECGTSLGNASNHHAMSIDGEIVYFTAEGHDHGPCPAGAEAPPVDELYARIGAATSVAVSQRSPTDCSGPCLSSAPGDARFEEASRDGTQVFFTDTQQLTDQASQDPSSSDSATMTRCQNTTGENGCNLYEYDFDAAVGHNLLTISAGDKSGHGPRVQRVMAVSPDGSHVYFVARGVLTTTANADGQTPTDGGENLYAFERDASHPGGHLAFVATLDAKDAGESASTVLQPNVTPEGRYLVFTSHADLTSDDTSGTSAAQVFRYDASTAQLLRVSVGDRGFGDNGNRPGDGGCANSEFCPRDASIAPSTNLARRDLTMSDDGSYVFFDSPVGLTPRALDEVVIGSNEGLPIYAQNVYEYHEGHVFLISDGKDTATAPRGRRSATELVGVDSSGADVFFTTSDQLVPQDTDTQLDYYDARTGGGFPAAPTAAACSEVDTCHAAPSLGAPAPLAASITFSGPGNQSGGGAGGSSHASVRLLSRTVHGSRFVLRVAVPGRGRLTVAGAGISRVTRVFAKGGTYRLTIKLTRRAKLALRRTRALKLRIRIVFIPAGGAPLAATTMISVRH
jgi:hypothetical protein